MITCISSLHGQWFNFVTLTVETSVWLYLRQSQTFRHGFTSLSVPGIFWIPLLKEF